MGIRVSKVCIKLNVLGKLFAQRQKIFDVVARKIRSVASRLVNMCLCKVYLKERENCA